jgi:hypothetical protein
MREQKRSGRRDQPCGSSRAPQCWLVPFTPRATGIPTLTRHSKKRSGRPFAACCRSRPRRQPDPIGVMRSSTTATGSSSAAMARPCACSRAAVTNGPADFQQSPMLPASFGSRAAQRLIDARRRHSRARRPGLVGLALQQPFLRLVRAGGASHFQRRRGRRRSNQPLHGFVADFALQRDKARGAARGRPNGTHRSDKPFRRHRQAGVEHGRGPP